LKNTNADPLGGATLDQDADLGIGTEAIYGSLGEIRKAKRANRLDRRHVGQM
jgi:hypothetical protein